MNAMISPRGGAPVGFVSDLCPVAAGAVRCLRLWNDGPDAQAQIWNEFSGALGPERGKAALTSFASLNDLCVRHGRRPLLRHNVSCECLGADESCFAHFIGYACDGEQEDAFLMAATLVRPDIAPSLVGLAMEFGFALRLIANTRKTLNPKSKNLH